MIYSKKLQRIIPKSQGNKVDIQTQKTHGITNRHDWKRNLPQNDSETMENGKKTQ